MLKMVRQAHHPTGKRAQKRWKMTTNAYKVKTNEGYFKTRFARDAQKNTEFRVQRPEFRVQKKSAYHRSQTAICELSYDVTNFMTASSFLV